MNTTSIIRAINSSLHSSIRALWEVRDISLLVQYLFDHIVTIGQDVDRRQAAVDALAEAVNTTEHARNASSEYLGLVQEALQRLQPVDATKVDAIRQLLNDTRQAVEEASVYETYQGLLRQLNEQRRERQRLESELDQLTADMEHLRRVNATLPTLPDICN